MMKMIQPDDVVVMISALTPDKGRGVDTLLDNISMGGNIGSFFENGGKCSQLIYISSDAIYDDDAKLINEKSICSPNTFHGLMHFTREQILLQSIQQMKTPLLRLRPTLLYGPEDTHNGYGPNRFVDNAINQNEITLFGNGEEKRDHVYIKDLCNLIFLSIRYRTKGVLNIATGESVSFYEIAQTIVKSMESEVRMDKLPRAVPITHRYFDVVSLRKGFPSYRFTPLEQGLLETIKSEKPEVAIKSWTGN